MEIPESFWVGYIDRLRKISEKAAEEFTKYYVSVPETASATAGKALTRYAYLLGTRYGEAAAELACEMYDDVAAFEGAAVPPAVPAPTVTYSETAKMIQGILKVSQNVELLASAVGRTAKVAAVDTTIQNAKRDGAKAAWIPHGDTCAYCIAMAGAGWQDVSDSMMENGHAKHIHANCDCTYAVRHSNDTTVGGYDPTLYKRMYVKGADVPYENEDMSHPEHKNLSTRRINGMRREFYKQNREKILAQKASAAEKRKELEQSWAEEHNT